MRSYYIWKTSLGCPSTEPAEASRTTALGAMSAARAARTQSWQGNCDDLPPDRHPRARYRSTCGGEDGKANLKRVQRLWRQEGLRVAAWAAEAGSQRMRAMQINEVRCFDFVFDRTEDGMRIK